MIIATLVAGSSIGYLFATGQLGLLPFGPGTQPPVLLALVNYTISYDQNEQNPTVATLWLRNLGTSTGTITTLEIQDTGDNGPVLCTFHPNQTIGAHGGMAEVVVDTASSGFHFSHGYSYWITITSNTGSQIGFHINY